MCQLSETKRCARALARGANTDCGILSPHFAAASRVDAFGTCVATDADMNTDRVRISRTVRASVSADGLVLLDLERGLVLASNPIGAQIWQLIETGLSRSEIAGRLVRDYGITRDAAERDLAAFLSSLTDRGLVTSEPE